MKPGVLLGDSWRAALAQRTSTISTFLVVMATVIAALLTAGQNAASAEQLRHHIDSTGARILTVTDRSDDQWITAEKIEHLGAVSGVERAVGFSPVRDVRALPLEGAAPVSAREVSDISAVARVVVGKLPPSGTGVVVGAETTAALHFSAPVGYVESEAGEGFPLAGEVAARSGFEDLTGTILTVATPATHYREVRVIVTDLAVIETVTSALYAIIGTSDGAIVTIDNPSGVAAASQLFSAQYARYGAAVLLGILTAGAIFTAIISMTNVIANRRDLGRRRALGSTRAQLALFTVGQAALPAIGGAFLGAVAGLAIAATWLEPVPLRSALAIWILVVVTAVAAPVIPAIWASRRDPVAVLRTP